MHGGPSNAASMDLDLISWLEHAGRVDLESALPPGEAMVFKDLTFLFRSPLEPETVQEVEGIPRSYMDPVLHEDSTYVELIRQMSKRDMVVFEDEMKMELGICAASESDHPSSPKTRLASAGAVVEYQGNASKSLYFGAQDISDCYYQFRVPGFLIKYLAFLRCEPPQWESQEWEIGMWVSKTLSIRASDADGAGMGAPLDAVCAPLHVEYFQLGKQ
eukprot:3027178-Amphidinium_carterae.1